MRNDEFTAIALGLLSSLYNAAFRLTRDEHDAEDLVQDTYAYAFEHANELRSPAAAKTWLLRILYHRFISLRRTARARPELKFSTAASRNLRWQSKWRCASSMQQSGVSLAPPSPRPSSGCPRSFAPPWSCATSRDSHTRRSPKLWTARWARSAPGSPGRVNI